MAWDGASTILARLFAVVGGCLIILIWRAVVDRWPAGKEETFEVCRDNLGRSGRCLGLGVAESIASLVCRCVSETGEVFDVPCLWDEFGCGSSSRF